MCRLISSNFQSNLMSFLLRCSILLLPTISVVFGVFNDIHVKEGIKEFIVAESDGGLSNRLRVLISHLYLAEVLHNNAHLVFIWDVNDACPGHFLHIFKPIPSVTFVSSEKIISSSNFTFLKGNTTSFTYLSRFALKVYPRSRDG